MASRVFRSLFHQISVRKTPLSSRKMSDCKVNIIDFGCLSSKMKSGTLLLVDVREPSELQNDGKIPDSVNIPLGQLVEAFKLNDGDFFRKYGVAKPKVEEFVLSCRSGKRAADASQRLKALGYGDALVYSGSFQDWVKNGGSVEK